MNIEPPSSATQNQARPGLCPICGLIADNGIRIDSELTASATYVDTAGHLFSVMWAVA